MFVRVGEQPIFPVEIAEWIQCHALQVQASSKPWKKERLELHFPRAAIPKWLSSGLTWWRMLEKKATFCKNWYCNIVSAVIMSYTWLPACYKHISGILNAGEYHQALKHMIHILDVKYKEGNLQQPRANEKLHCMCAGATAW